MTTKVGTMTNEERLQKTIRLQKTDKILSGPSIDAFAAICAGMTVKEYFQDADKAEEAYERTFYQLGGWDIMRAQARAADGTQVNSVSLMRRLLPGRDLAESTVNQVTEEEIMLPEDYDFVIDNGFNALQERLVQRMSPGQLPAKRQQLAAEANNRMQASIEKWQARGLVRLSGGAIGAHPFTWFSFHRSLPRFSMDVRRMPDKVKAAIKACLPDMIANGKEATKASGIRRVNMVNSRAANTFIGAKQFEEFVLPTWLEFVNAMADADIDVIFHCDSDWTGFLPYFKEFPRARCVLQLDGVTDIFKAKEVLRDHMTLMGDVLATLLSLDTPEAVFAYCQKLVKVVGQGGGFILSSGCTTPYNAKIENVRAMVRAGNELTWT